MTNKEMTNKETKNERHVKKIVLIILLVLLCACSVASVIYVQDYYHASPEVKENLESSLVADGQTKMHSADDQAQTDVQPVTDGQANKELEDNASEMDGTEEKQTYTVTYTEDKLWIFTPAEKIEAGLIFYPGGKVEYTAYAPLLEALAQRGILCVLVHMPCNLAVLDISAANGIREQFPAISDWYLAGHSLGGAMAAVYISSHEQEYEGLILLGAYSTSDLTESGLQVLSIYGSEDRVLNRESYEKNKSNLPSDWTEYVIEGGCHSYFGDYGMQDGDGTPTITREQQMEMTAEAIAGFVSR